MYNNGYQQPYYGGQRQSYYQQRPPYYGQQQRPPQKKRSGAKKTVYMPRNGKNANEQQVMTTGWKKTRGAFIAVKCQTTHKSRDTGKGWVGNVACHVTNRTTGEDRLYWGTMQISTGKVIIRDIAWTVNPSAPNGGYCGTYLKRKNR